MAAGPCSYGTFKLPAVWQRQADTGRVSAWVVHACMHGDGKLVLARCVHACGFESIGAVYGLANWVGSTRLNTCAPGGCVHVTLVSYQCLCGSVDAWRSLYSRAEQGGFLLAQDGGLSL